MPVVAFLLTLLVCSSALAQERLVITIPLATGLSRPTAIVHAGDDSGRLFIVEQSGRVLVHQHGEIQPAAFLDITARVSCCGERGLLGIAFHPDFANNGTFFVNYTDVAGDTVVARYQLSVNRNLADVSTEEILLRVQQPFSNHNGGNLVFGPDGLLYVGLGDGGSGGDPRNNAQDSQSLLGKMLRLEVGASGGYSIPPDNPFAADDFTLDEIWALGLRNPFRYSFDSATGRLFIADVGQNAIEEVNIQPADSSGGENYGWRLMEGSSCFNPPDGCNNGSLTLPAFEYGHSEGRCSITGGYVYRGTRIEELRGDYIYGDFCSGEIFMARENTAGNWSQSVLLDTSFGISTFGQDERGELLVADINGGVYQLTDPLAISPASGVYFQSQLIDLGLVLRISAVSINSLSATLNGVDVSTAFDDCAVSGELDVGGLTLRCPGIPLTILTPGEYRFTVTLSLSDGSTVSDSVDWTVLANSEA